MSSSIQKTGALLQSGGCLELERIFTQIKKLADLQKQIARYIDTKIMSYCQVANVKENKLILLVANGAIATQIRFQTEELLNRFKQDHLLKHIFSIECKVRPSHPTSSRLGNRDVSQPLAPLTKETSALIESSAQGIKDPGLRETMVRIAKHTEPDTEPVS